MTDLRWRGQFFPAYACTVIDDGDSFRAECCNPDCAGAVTNRYAAPWCVGCGELVPDKWRLWFWNSWWTAPETAFTTLLRGVFGA